MKIAFNLMCVAVLFAFALGNTRYNSTLYQKNNQCYFKNILLIPFVGYCSQLRNAYDQQST